jgi:hypothetical protein
MTKGSFWGERPHPSLVKNEASPALKIPPILPKEAGGAEEADQEENHLIHSLQQGSAVRLRQMPRGLGVSSKSLIPPRLGDKGG